jgi:DNA-binding ferritin-like protein
MSAEHVQFFFGMREQIKLYHWQTHSYSRHKATDDLINELDKNIDDFVEIYMGKYGRPKMTQRTQTIRVANLNEKTIHSFVRTCIGVLQKDITHDLDPKKDTDLLNLRDEMLGDLNKLLYLFSLQ